MREQKPSATACLVAASLGFSAGNPQLAGLVNPIAAGSSRAFMKAYGAPATFFAHLLFKPWFRPFVYRVEHATIPGISLHYLLRKRFIEDQAKQLLQKGIRQVVVLGAGFDVLATTLHPLFPQTIFLEVDHPATQRAKREALSGCRLGENLVFIPVDLARQSLSERLLAHPRFKTGENTLFIAEAVLMYLPESEISGLFRFFYNHTGRDSVFAFTFMEPRADGKVNFHNGSRIVDLWMHLRGEPFAWGISKERIGAFLSPLHFDVAELATPEVLRTRYLNTVPLARLPLAEGEYICVSRKVSS